MYCNLPKTCSYQALNNFKLCLWSCDSIIKSFLTDLNIISFVSKSVKSIIYTALSLIALLARKLYNALSKKHLRPCTHMICYTTIITSYIFLSIFGYHNHYDLTLILDKFGVLPKRFMFMNEWALVEKTFRWKLLYKILGFGSE